MRNEIIKEIQLELFKKDNKEDIVPEGMVDLSKQFNYYRCDNCNEVMATCHKCKVLFKNGDEYYCVETSEGSYNKHYCKKCGEEKNL